MTFHSVGNVIIPTDELIFFRGIETTNQDKKSMTNGIFMGFPWDFHGIFVGLMDGLTGMTNGIRMD